MGHEHHHESRTAFFMEQLLTIATCGGLGVVMILLYDYNVLPIFLDPKFHEPVLWGGIALLVLVGIRAIALWRFAGQGGGAHEQHDHASAGEPEHEHDHGHEHAHSHNHDHSHAHDHDHGHDHVHAAVQEHDHGHDHDHSFAPWRYLVLLLPIVLFALKLPWPEPPEQVEKDVIPMKLANIEEAGENTVLQEQLKEEMKTQSLQLKGKFAPVAGDRILRLTRKRMTCCFADAYDEPANFVVLAREKLNFDRLKERGGWIKVVGKVEFRPVKERNGETHDVPVVIADKVVAISTPANQFDN